MLRRICWLPVSVCRSSPRALSFQAFPRLSPINHNFGIRRFSSEYTMTSKISEEQHLNAPGKERTLQIAFLVCDEPAEPTLREHGGFHEYV